MERILVTIRIRLVQAPWGSSHLLQRVDFINQRILSWLWHSSQIGGTRVTLEREVRDLVSPWIYKGSQRGWVPWEVACVERGKGALGIQHIPATISAVHGSWIARNLLADTNVAIVFRRVLAHHLRVHLRALPAIPLTRHSGTWIQSRTDNTLPFFSHVLNAFHQHQLSLKPNLSWASLTALQVAALPWYMPEYAIRHSFHNFDLHVRELWRCGWLTFADILWVRLPPLRVPHLAVPDRDEAAMDLHRPSHHSL